MGNLSRALQQLQKGNHRKFVCLVLLHARPMISAVNSSGVQAGQFKVFKHEWLIKLLVRPGNDELAWLCKKRCCIDDFLELPPET